MFPWMWEEKVEEGEEEETACNIVFSGTAAVNTGKGIAPYPWFKKACWCSVVLICLKLQATVYLVQTNSDHVTEDWEKHKQPY